MFLMVFSITTIFHSYMYVSEFYLYHSFSQFTNFHSFSQFSAIFPIPTHSPIPGGLGLGKKHWVRVCETLGSIDLSLFFNVAASNDFAIQMITQYGTPEQKVKYLPLLATGKLHATICLQEPHW